MVHSSSWILILLSALLGPVQEGPSPDEAKREIRRRLWSGDPRDVAWGAYEAGSRRMIDARFDLIEVLPACTGQPEREWSRARSAVLDALVRLEAKLPIELLTPFLYRFPRPNAARILLANAARADENCLLSLLPRLAGRDGSVSIEELLIGNLLCELRAAPFAKQLLPLSSMELTVYVGCWGRSGGYVGGGVGMPGSGRGGAAIPPLQGFPPFVTYDLRRGDPKDGRWSLVADGPRPIYYRRAEHLGDASDSTRGVGRLRYDECAAEWLADMAGVKVADAVLPENDWLVVHWGDVQRVVSRVTAARDELLDRYWNLVSCLVQQKVLTSEEARGLSMRVLVPVVGRQAHWIGPFPELPPPRDPPEFLDEVRER